MPANTHPIAWKRVASLIEQQFPDFLRTDGPNFVAFMKAYYEWMDQQNNPNYSLRNFQSWRDVDRTLESFITWFQGEFMVRIPDTVLADKRLLVKHIQEFYRSKGTQKAYNFLFRILYNEDLEYFYPGSELLRYNDGKWIVRKTLILSALTSDSLLFSSKSQRIEGKGSGTTSLVEEVEKQVTTIGEIIFELDISNTIGSWETDERVELNGIEIGKIKEVKVYSGRYKEKEGADSRHKIQDSFFWQEYSYQLKSSQPLSRYRKIVRELVHPAGTRMFGEVLIQGELDSEFTISSEFRQVDPSQLLVAQNIIQLIIPLFSSITSVFIDVTAAAGVARIANSLFDVGDYSDYPIASFNSWTVSNFIDGKGLLGTGTDWVANLTSGQILVEDGDAVHANAVHMRVSTDSANTATMGPGYFDTKSANLTIYSY